jgi:hypothetical protein
MRTRKSLTPPCALRKKPAPLRGWLGCRGNLGSDRRSYLGPADPIVRNLAQNLNAEPHVPLRVTGGRERKPWIIGLRQLWSGSGRALNESAFGISGHNPLESLGGKSRQNSK